MAGVSLIELMVALAIGAVLMLGLVQVFGASRAAYATAEGVSRVQENARFALDYLQRDVRMAGHFGCVNDQAHWVKEQGDLTTHFGTVGVTDPRNFNVSILGFEATNTQPSSSSADTVVTLGAATAGWSPALPATITALNPVPGSDIIALRFLSAGGVAVSGLAAAGAGGTTVGFDGGNAGGLTSDGVASPALFGVADCQRANVFPTSSVNIAAGTLTSTGTDFSQEYTTGNSGMTTLYRAESLVYYVALNVGGEPALFRGRFNGTAYVPEELVEGIESLQFLYGRDATAVIGQQTPPAGSVIEQDTANTLGTNQNQWLRVGLVQMGLLARSPNPAAASVPVGDEQQPRVLGVRFAPPETSDSRYRASYEATVALRNRLFGN